MDQQPKPAPAEINMTPEQAETINQAVNALANEYHEDWRQTRAQEDGSFEPRIKDTSDEAWVESHGSNQVDIANTSYDDLPADWQAENKAAAVAVVDIMLDNSGDLDLANSEIRSKVGDQIHSAWLSRNEWASGGDLDKPFDDLPLDEQEKDIRQAEIAQKLFNGEK